MQSRNFRSCPLKREIDGELSQRLREWGHFFRDRRRWTRCASIEGKFQPGSDDYSKEGWGDPERTPTPAPKEKNWILRALAVQDALSALSKIQGGRTYVWALTYHYAYPYLSRGLVLRCMKKHSQRHLTWKDYLDQVEIARFRLAVLLK